VDKGDVLEEDIMGPDDPESEGLVTVFFVVLSHTLGKPITQMLR
jgi:hypothetical protein